jgi:hypothetical protein
LVAEGSSPHFGGLYQAKINPLMAGSVVPEGVRMDMMSLVSAQMSAQMGRAQMAVAASIMKTNAGHDAEIVQMIEAGQANLSQLSSAAAGLGQNLDISV